jgi:V/A-type H+-transporting ATPase subunit D
MAEIKLTKNELRAQQNRLNLLLKYLPTLQLKKALLQLEVGEARTEIARAEGEYAAQMQITDDFAAVLTDRLSFPIAAAVSILEVKTRYENIAGVEVPSLDAIEFRPFDYALIDTPAWVDGALIHLKKLASCKITLAIAEAKKRALERELREVSIRVNLFEKVLIPRAEANIRKIKVFLGDQLLAAVSRAKVAKSKIEAARAAYAR